MIHYIAHGKGDAVGVMTVDVKKGQTLRGWNMATDKMTRPPAERKAGPVSLMLSGARLLAPI